MAGTQHDRQRQREEYQQNEERDRDAEAAPGFGCVDRRQGRGRLWRLAAVIARQYVFFIETEGLGVRAQKAAHEHIRRQMRLLVALELFQEASGNASSPGEFRDRNLPQLPFPFQIASE
jgi:hypothetical protein